MLSKRVSWKESQGVDDGWKYALKDSKLPTTWEFP